MPHKTPEEQLDARHPGLASRLGKERDIDLAKEYNLTRERVRQIRNKHGVKSFDTNLREQIIHDLNTLKGGKRFEQAAKKYKMTKQEFARYCRQNGMETFIPQRVWGKGFFEKNPKAKALLGTMSDGKLAAKLGMPLQRCLEARKKYGIPAWSKSGGKKSIVTNRKGLGGKSNDWFDVHGHVELLGTMSDTALGHKLGITSGTVAKARNRRGIVPLMCKTTPKRWLTGEPKAPKKKPRPKVRLDKIPD